MTNPALITSFVTELIALAGSLERRIDRALSAVKGISFAEYRLLDAIDASPAGAASRIDLADAVGLTPSGVSRALKPLDKLGVVESVRSGRDARHTLATLTPSGRELLADARQVLHDTATSLMADDVDPTIVAQLRAAIRP